MWMHLDRVINILSLEVNIPPHPSLARPCEAVSK